MFRALRPLWGAALFLALAAPWFVAITIKSDGAFWAASLGRDMFEKIANARENHGAPPGTYLAVLWLTFWPGSMLLAAVVPFLWRNRAAPALMFAVVWAVPTWVVFELTATKLVHYVLPTYPALALICAWLLWQGGAARSWLASLPVLVPALIFGFMWYEAGKLDAPLPLWFWAASGLTVLATAWVVWALRRAAPVPLAFSLAAAGFALSGTVYPTLAQMNALWPARTIAAIAQGHPDCRLIVAGFAEPSLVFLTRNKVSFVSADAAKAALAAPDCAVIAMARADAPGMAFDTEVTGLDLGSGKPVDLLVFVRP